MLTSLVLAVTIIWILFLSIPGKPREAKEAKGSQSKPPSLSSPPEEAPSPSGTPEQAPSAHTCHIIEYNVISYNRTSYNHII